MSTCGSPLFMSIETPSTRTRWESFAASYLVQAALVTALVVFTIVSPKIADPLISHVTLIAPSFAAEVKPVPVQPAPVKVAARPLVKVKHLQPVQRARVVPPPPAVVPAREQVPVLQLQQPQRIQVMARVQEMEPAAAPAPRLEFLPPLPSPKIATYAGSSAPPTLAKVAPSKVQTGGFGDPNGVPVNAHGSDRPNIAAVGSFELPQGGGYGNGTGGTRGLRGTVASAGFGNGVATQIATGRAGNGRAHSAGFGNGVAQGGGNGNGGGQPHLQAAGFSNAAAPVPAEARQIRSLNSPPSSAPLSIQSKPTPLYTPEARQLKVEGEVLLNVLFTADGQIHVLKVVRGLGHGLDEAAQHAAQGIRFSPAMHDGHPVDSNVTLHIVFQLS